jgi:hypothetical protein
MFHFPSGAREPYALEALKLHQRIFAKPTERVTQVYPFWIGRREQSDLLFAPELLDLLFTTLCIAGIAENFIVHKSMNVIAPGKSIHQAFTVFMEPSG